jgi:zinc protease
MTTAVRGLAPVRQSFENGAVVLVQQTATHPAVTLHVTLLAGSCYDPADCVGLAHFVSRVIDRGTVGRTADELGEALDGRGVTLNVHVTRHLFTLSCVCLSEDLEAVLDIVADVVTRPIFPPAEVETRRGEIVTAIRQDEDSPAAVAGDALMGLLYPAGHPYGRPPKGSVSGVEGITREHLVEFHRRRFFPEGLLVTIVGDVAPARAVDAAWQSFGGWHVPPLPSLVPSSPLRLAGRQQLVVPMMNKTQVDIAYGFAALTRHDADYLPLLLVNNVLGQYGLGGRLGDSIRERQGMAYYVFSSFEGNVAEGPLVVRAGVAPGDVERTVVSIDREVHAMDVDGVTDAELADAKRYLSGSLPRLLETNGGIASFLQTAELFALGLDYDLRLPRLLDAVTREQAHAAATRVLDADRAALAIAGPWSPQAGAAAAAAARDASSGGATTT